MTLIKERTVFSLERAPNMNKTVTVKQEIISGWSSTRRQFDWLTVSRNVTLINNSRSNSEGSSFGTPVYRNMNLGAEELNWVESSFRNWQLQNNGKKGIRLCQGDVICDLKWQWDNYKSVARIRLVKTAKPSACVMVNCKVCKSAIALYFL
jgi:hypothetical protein